MMMRTARHAAPRWHADLQPGPSSSDSADHSDLPGGAGTLT